MSVASTSWLARYGSGKRIEVWGEMVALGVEIRKPEYLGEATAVARETMRRARQNVETLIVRLAEMGYGFPGGMKAIVHPEVWTRPDASTRNQLDSFEARIGGPLPLSLRCWLEEVGFVSLMGKHPLLCRGVTPGEHPLPKPLADPLVAYPDCEGWVEEAPWDDELPKELSLAPDRYGKANYSGGECGMRVPDASADGVFLNANQLLFVDYLRYAFRWGGFPGWANYRERPERELKHLAEGLLAI